MLPKKLALWNLLKMKTAVNESRRELRQRSAMHKHHVPRCQCFTIVVGPEKKNLCA